MPARPFTTILLLTREQIVRADFTRGKRPELIESYSQPRGDVHDMATAVEIGAALGPKLGRNVWVLDADVWTQTIALGGPRNVAAGMKEADLAAALNFEAESLSGMSAFESAAGYRPLAEGQGYWVIQARTAELEQAAELLRRRGSRLAGLLHPGGAPSALGEASGGQAWQRVELWPDAVIALSGDSAGAVSVRVLHADPTAGRWQGEWETWRQAQGAAQSHAVLAPTGTPTLPAGANHFRLDDEAALNVWLTAWAAELANGAVAVPVLRPQTPPMSVNTRWAMALGLGAAALALCFLHNWIMQSSIDRLKGDLGEAQSRIAKMDDAKKQVKAQEEKGVDLRKEQDRLTRIVQSAQQQRRRLADLLVKLSLRQSDELMVEELKLDPQGEPIVKGKCLRPELADQFASHLAQTLVGYAWEVQGARKTAKQLLADGGPWEFEIAFKRVAPAVSDAPVTKKGKQ